MLIKKYTSDWIKDFSELRREIEYRLKGLELRIEHVGSTSVPDLDSKDIIDMVVIYKHNKEFDSIKLGLMAMGYFHNGNQGVEGREVFKRSGDHYIAILDSKTHHLYACQADSKALEEQILFRDHLKRNSRARAKYQQMKYQLADKANQDRKRYAELKEQSIGDFIAKTIEVERLIIQK